jgi:succinate dehydrogenase membrane anchor subunit
MSEPGVRMETPLGRVRGLGSARHGAEHWWHERLSSTATFLLFTWLIVSLLRLPDLGYATVAEWLREPFAAVPMLLLVAATFWHLKMGLRVIFAAIFGAVLALFSVLKVALSGDGTTGA